MRKSIRGAFLRELTAFFIVPFVLILTILGMYIVITVKSDAEHQTRVMESMIANEISMERSRHIRTLKKYLQRNIQSAGLWQRL